MEDAMKSDQDSSSMKGKGGFRAASFVYALVSLENMGFVANMVSFVLYFQLQMYFKVSAAANTVTNLMGSTYLLSIFGGFISDTYINRFKTCLIFGVFELAALLLMTVQARYKDLQPSPCGKSSCLAGRIAVMFYASLSLVAMGTGGVRGALPALGADQFNQKDPKESKALATYFNFLLLSSTLGATIGVTIIVWVATNRHWWPGFLISLLATLVGFIFLVLGKPFYRLQLPGDSPLLRVIQVIVVAIKNRSLQHPSSPEELYEPEDKESSISTDQKIQHTEQFRCLDKAAILRDSNTKPAPWTVCTVTQVEEVKVLTRMLPIIASTIILNTCMAQLQTFSVTQGYYMNRLLGSFEVPAPSVPVIPLVFISILIPIYEFFFVPFARKITNHPSGVTQLQRVGVGLVLSVVSMTVAGFVEVKRKNHDLTYGKPVHVVWLSFQYGIFGIADMFTLVGLLEFFYKEAPVGMRSLSTSFTWLTQSFGYFLSSIFVDIINSVTRRTTHSKRGWLDGKLLDENHLDYFFWFLAILSLLNFFNYLYWASWYKYKQENVSSSADGICWSTNAMCAPQSLSASGVPLFKEPDDQADQNEAKKTRTTATNGNGIVGNDEKSTEEANGKS
ncbi:protein NRT1/ PTR FAMILY 4.5-like isoform X1 [Coffea eugenioides]|uniref:protein NRT1/ PTR FAMILY 4.5-like isoform X1 n=2 Tax=Coffea eugenioides TaxID=49369 RepID=UPI000F6070F7|nr:protein NRT1/ PTR FAMILY 4.5-like isoform X1 [Coffea eugenioides]